MRLDNAYYIYPSEYEYRSSEKCSRDEEMSPFEIDKFHKFQRVVTRNDRRLSTRIDQFSSLKYFFQRSIRATVRWKTYRVEFGSLLDRTSLRHRRFTRCHDDVGNALQYRKYLFSIESNLPGRDLTARTACVPIIGRIRRTGNAMTPFTFLSIV